ncbi:MAG: class I SAM-dependent methyltransferase [Deltaproteobacteria bacterium]|nr:class I SAM-dependent methyltransferase [Deltaproteobacteria bacterium]
MLNAVRKIVRSAYKSMKPLAGGRPPSSSTVALEDEIIVHFDSETGNSDSGRICLRGWVASRQPVERVILPEHSSISLPLVARPDVAAAYPQYPHTTGFEGFAEVSAGQQPWLRVDFKHTGGSTTRIVPLETSAPVKAKFKAEKLDRVAKLLCCPECKSSLSIDSEGIMECGSCRATFTRRPKYFDFLSSATREQFGVVDTLNVSSNDYDRIANSFIGKYYDGLILDCGAGKREFEFPNVINYEIVPYRSTDVLGINEKLPFKDASFDAVFSLAVLEHVKDPFKSAAELSRVLKPGGILYCVVPLLQPVHGYPNHYYNMTSQGLSNLFEGRIEITDRAVLQSGLPIWSLTWILRSWADGLNGEARANFLSMPIGNLIGEASSYLDRDFVKQLSAEKNFELASTTMIIGKKLA